MMDEPQELTLDDLPPTITQVSILRNFHNKRVSDPQVGAQISNLVSDFCVRSLREGAKLWEQSVAEILYQREHPEEILKQPTPFQVMVARLAAIHAEILTYGNKVDVNNYATWCRLHLGSSSGSLGSRNSDGVQRRRSASFDSDPTLSESNFSFESLATQVCACYQEIHSFADSELDQTLKLYLEFATGLRAALLLTESFRNALPFYVDHVNEVYRMKLDKHHFVIPRPSDFLIDHSVYGFEEYLAAASIKIGDSLVDIFPKDTPEVRTSNAIFPDSINAAYHAFLDACPDIHKAHLLLMSLRHIPEQWPEFLCFAQALHWFGMGGSGDIFLRNPDVGLQHLASTASLHRPSSDHGAQGYSGDFASAMRLVMQPYRDYFIEVLARLLEAYPSQDIRYFEDGTGPGMYVLSHVAQFLNSVSHDNRMEDDDPIVTSSTKKRVHCVLSDVFGGTFSSLLSCRARFAAESSGVSGAIPRLSIDVQEILFRDLVSGVEDFSAGLPMHKYQSSFDFYICSLVLHQTADRTRHQYFIRAMQLATTMVKAKGFIVLGDPAWKDLAVCHFPVNLIDREGCMPESMNDAFGFRRLAVSDDKRHNYYKVPVLIPQLYKKIAYLTTSIYMVVSLQLEEIEKLDRMSPEERHIVVHELVGSDDVVEQVFSMLP